MLSGRVLCNELITRPEESYRLWCVVVCNLETSIMRRPGPRGGGGLLRRKQTKYSVKIGIRLSCLRIWFIPDLCGEGNE